MPYHQNNSDVHILKNSTSLTCKSSSVDEILIGRFELFSLAAHLTKCFISNLFRRGTQTVGRTVRKRTSETRKSQVQQTREKELQYLRLRFTQQIFRLRNETLRIQIAEIFYVAIRCLIGNIPNLVERSRNFSTKRSNFSLGTLLCLSNPSGISRNFRQTVHGDSTFARFIQQSFTFQ